MFKDFGRRLQRDVNKLINNRIKISSELAGNAIKAEPMKVEVRDYWLTSSDINRDLRSSPTLCKDMQSGSVVR